MIKLLMKIKFFCALIIFPSLLNASNNCFIAKENGIVIKEIGVCDVRHSPFSTFKIPLCIMAFDAGIFNDSEKNLIAFTSEIEKKYVTFYDPEKYPTMLFWKKDHTPKTWMRDSVVWFSRYITNNLGIEKFQNYIQKFNYGNKICIHENNINAALMDSWLGFPLEISPKEQVEFIEKLTKKSINASKESQEKTISILKLDTIYQDWQLYGKTGGTKSSGWFVGWIEKNNRRIEFAQYIEQPETSLLSAGRVAKEVAKDNLISICINH